MGANAQTTVQKFLSGAVLTAEQQNFSAATGVPVFATTVTRDAAFGGANKVLAEGQTCYLESTNVVQYYDGAAWATVGPAAASALVRINGAALSGATVTLNNIFSATYNFYHVVLSAPTSSSGDHIAIQLVDSGGTAVATGYVGSRMVVPYGGGAISNSAGASTSWDLAGNSQPNGDSSTDFYISNPFAAQPTFINSRWNKFDNAAQFNGQHSTAASYTGVKLTPPSAFTAGVMNVYGYSLS